MIVLLNNIAKQKKICFLCVGSDYILWDALGPMTGTILKNYVLKDSIRHKVCGTIDNTLNGVNIEQKYLSLKQKETDDTIYIAIDVGISNKAEEQNKIFIRDRGIIPGAGIGRSGNQIGDYAIVYLVSKQQFHGKIFLNEVMEIVIKIVNIIKTILEIS